MSTGENSRNSFNPCTYTTYKSLDTLESQFFQTKNQNSILNCAQLTSSELKNTKLNITLPLMPTQKKTNLKKIIFNNKNQSKFKINLDNKLNSEDRKVINNNANERESWVHFSKKTTSVKQLLEKEKERDVVIMDLGHKKTLSCDIYCQSKLYSNNSINSNSQQRHRRVHSEQILDYEKNNIILDEFSKLAISRCDENKSNLELKFEPDFDWIVEGGDHWLNDHDKPGQDDSSELNDDLADMTSSNNSDIICYQK